MNSIKKNINSGAKTDKVYFDKFKNFAAPTAADEFEFLFNILFLNIFRIEGVIMSDAPPLISINSISSIRDWPWSQPDVRRSTRFEAIPLPMPYIKSDTLLL